jgi:hypothetical protein
MKRTVISIIVVVLASFLSGEAIAQQDLVETISRNCRGEIARFCGEVSPGRSRMLACLYAYSDKLDAACGLALVDAAPELDRTIAKVAAIAKACRSDLRAYCSKVSPGEGRLKDCMDKNGDKVSDQCKESLATGGLNRF